MWRRTVLVFLSLVLLGACGADGEPSSVVAAPAPTTAPATSAPSGIGIAVDEVEEAAPPTTAASVATVVPDGIGTRIEEGSEVDGDGITFEVEGFCRDAEALLAEVEALGGEPPADPADQDRLAGAYMELAIAFRVAHGQPADVVAEVESCFLPVAEAVEG